MQALWTRVAQIKGACHCPHCLSAPHGVSQRTAANAGRHRPRYLTSSTLWYSGIFAAAATFDAATKVHRREQWDRAIADVKEEISSVDRVITSAPQTGASAGRGSRYSQYEEKYLAFDGDTLETQSELEANIDLTAPERKVPAWPPNTGTITPSDRMAPQSIYADARSKARAAETRWGDKKMERVQMTMDLLQLKAISEIQQRRWKGKALGCVSRDYTRHIDRDPKELGRAFVSKRADLKRLIAGKPWDITSFRRSEEDMPLSNYHQDGAGLFHSTTRELNRCLRELFRLNREGLLPRAELFTKVYYNLYISSSPPNIDTFNTLIIGFARAREPEQVRNIISAVRISRMRPNEVTLASVFRFFTAVRDSDAFATWYGWMQGILGGGLMLARQNIRVGLSAQNFLLDQREGAPDGKVIQLPRPTPMVFGAIVRGVLQFEGFHAALDLCERMGFAGWGLCMHGLAPLLKDCERRADWSAGHDVWELIRELHSQEGRLANSTRKPVKPIHIDTYVSMLRLCARCKRKDIFETVVDDVSAAHRLKGDALVNLIRAAMQDEPEYRYIASTEAGPPSESDQSPSSKEWEDLVGTTGKSHPLATDFSAAGDSGPPVTQEHAGHDLFVMPQHFDRHAREASVVAAQIDEVNNWPSLSGAMLDELVKADDVILDDTRGRRMNFAAN